MDAKTGLAKDQAHYQQSELQPIEVIQRTSTKEETKGHLRNTILKYLLRAKYKENELKDYEKALQFCTWLVQVEKGEMINPREVNRMISETYPIIPATKFVKNDPAKQFDHLCSEWKEVNDEWMAMAAGVNPAKLAEELIDLQMSAETMLAVLGLDDKDRESVRKSVIAKNAARGYYNTEVTNANRAANP